MDGEKYQNRLACQLETFYLDNHIEVNELPEPELLPFREDWYMAAARLELKLQGKKERYYPIKHIDVEGFENDPYGSITSDTDSRYTSPVSSGTSANSSVRKSLSKAEICSMSRSLASTPVR